MLERDTAPPPAPSGRREPASDPQPEPRRFVAPLTDSDTLSLTGLLVEELWNLSPDEDILGWAPGDMDATLVRSGIRTWKMLATGALVVVALAVGWRALTWEDARLAESIEAVTGASLELVSRVETLDASVTDIADGSIDDPLAASITLAHLDDSARLLFAVAGDMPATEEMAPIRGEAISQAGGALDLGTTLSESVAYAAAVELITRPVDLPAETDIEGLPLVTETVTRWVGDFTSGAAALPANELTDTHRDALADLAASLPEWQASYLDALRARDRERAAVHVSELQTQITFVRESWTSTAAGIAEWAGQRIDSLSVPLVVNR